MIDKFNFLLEKERHVIRIMNHINTGIVVMSSLEDTHCTGNMHNGLIKLCDVWERCSVEQLEILDKIFNNNDFVIDLCEN